MNNYLLILPLALLVAFSQILIKLRADAGGDVSTTGLWPRVLHFASDPVVLLAYGCALFASFAWLYVVARLPLTIAFPVYIGVTFLFVVAGSWLFLGETMSSPRLLGVGLILAGIALAMQSDA
jgi:multidrug transporter EmrE-like cation transporter